MTSQPPEAEIIQAAQRFKAALARKDAQALKRLTDAYLQMYRRLQDKITILLDGIELEAPTMGEVVRMRRYLSLMNQIEDELKAYQIIIRNEVERVAQTGIAAGGSDSLALMRLAANQYGIRASFNALPKRTIEQLLGFLADDSPLYKRLELLAPYTVKQVGEAIVEGVGLGYNPRKIAAGIRKQFGMALTDALRTTRTVQINSYREATRANYLMNSDVVVGWIWIADFSPRTCVSCLNKHGTVHDLSERQRDHWNGRCGQIPLLAGQENPLGEGRGEEWFKSQSKAIQERMMGKERLAAYSAGKFKFTQLSKETPDAVWGSMFVETPLKDLVTE